VIFRSPWGIAVELESWRPILENVLIFEKKGGLYGQNLPYKFKKLYGDLDYIELLVPGQI
jgi:hypothetical protein